MIKIFGDTRVTQKNFQTFCSDFGFVSRLRILIFVSWLRTGNEEHIRIFSVDT